jgi:two-component system, LytTR family, response regulator
VRVVAVDDEPLARRGIRKRLAVYPDVEVVAECPNGATAIAAIRELAPDLVFLDIKMPDIGGFKVLQDLAAGGGAGAKLPFIVFLTAFDSFALEAFRVHALDYLLKPIEDDQFANALNRARSQLQVAQHSGGVREGVNGWDR